MNSVRDLPIGIKEQDSLNEESGLTATVTGAPGFVSVTGHDYPCGAMSMSRLGGE